MSRQPVLFVSHGAPMFALSPERAGAQLAALGQRLPKPAAVVVVSPHWMPTDLAITANARPQTIHDFSGFPAELYALQYPAPGAPALAGRIAVLLRSVGVELRLDAERGLDHGVWVPLMHLFPAADVPVLQLSLPRWFDEGAAWRLGEMLEPLRDEGVLLIGSGSLTHNLYEVRMGDEEAEESYAREFVAWARQAVCAHDQAALVDYLQVAPHAGRAHPTAEHYLPLLVAAAAGGPDATVDVLDGEILYGVLSMESYVFGAFRSPATQP